MTDIAILGFGVVGSGIAKVIERSVLPVRRMTSDTINVKYILDKRDFPGTPYEDKVVKDMTVILSDPEVKIVCEAPEGSTDKVVYPAAVVKSSANAEAAKSYLEFLASDEAMKVFEKYGFVKPAE